MNDHISYDDFDPASADHTTRWSWTIYRPEDEKARVTLTLGPGESPDPKLEDRLWTAVGGDWKLGTRRHEPSELLPYGAPHPSKRAAILDDLEARLEAAGVAGASAVQALPTGWLRIGMVLVDRLCKWAAEEEPARIQDIKEKFGSLRVYTYGSDRVADLSDWCEEQSVCRCMATGKEGHSCNTGWVLTLSDNMFALYQEDRRAVERMMYPPREGADRS